MKSAGFILAMCIAASLMLIMGPRAGAQTATAPATLPFAQSSPAQALVIPLDDIIDNFARNAVIKGLDTARKAGIRQVVVKLDTPGGAGSSAMDITRAIRAASDLHTIAFVERHAISAGAMIAVACDEIVMEEQSLIGDCAPIIMAPGLGVQRLEGTERSKLESPVHAEFRASAEANGYDPLLLGAMVTVGRIVHFVQSSDGTRRFVEPQQYEKLLKDGWKPVEGVPDPVDGVDTLLTVDNKLAERLGLSKGTYSSLDSFVADRNLQIVMTLNRSSSEKFMSWFSAPAVRFFLLISFMLTLYIALHTPGHGFAEVLALLSLGLLVGAPLLTGYAQWWEVALIFIGLALLAIELFVIPGFGIAGIAGIILMLFGLVMTFVPVEPSGLPGILPSLKGTRDALERGIIVVVGGLACSLLLWVWLSRYLPRLPYFNRLILTDGGAGAATVPDIVSSAHEEEEWPRIGAAGRAVTDLRPGGTAEFHDPLLNDVRITDVVSDSGFISANTRLVVREHHGNRVVVRSIPEGT